MEYDTDEENLDVVQSDEGKFYTLRCQKPPTIKPILKMRSENIEIDDTESVRSYVNFDLGENEIRDFSKNDRVIAHTSKLSKPDKPKKKEKKQKGKGKNRKGVSIEEETERKIAKALKKRQEIEEAEIIAERQGLGLDDIEDLDVDDDFDYTDYDME